MPATEELSLKLLKASQDSNLVDLKLLLYQLVEAVEIPGDVSCLIGPVVKLLPSHNISVKKSAYWALARICMVHTDAAFLAANTLLRDCRDPNPVVKCMAISTLCSLPALLQEHATPTLNEALRDGNPRVRHVAVNGCCKVFKQSPQIIHDHGFVDRLYESIRDGDTTVVTSCLLALDTILASEGGVIVNRNMAMYLLGRLAEFPDPQLATVLQVLGKFHPTDDEDLFRELGLLDPYLVHASSAAVVVNCIQLFLTLTEQKFPHLQKDVVQRTVPVLKEFLASKSSKDSMNHVLDFLLNKRSSDGEWLSSFQSTPDYFHPREGEDLVVASKKLRIMPYVCSVENVEQVLSRLEEYCSDARASSDAFTCIRLISARLPSAAGAECLRVLASLLGSEDCVVQGRILHVLQDFDLRSFPASDIGSLLARVLSGADPSRPQDLPLAVPILAGEFGELLPDRTSNLFHSLAEKFESLAGDDVRTCLVLRASVQMFLKEPAKFQHILGQVLEQSLREDQSPELRETAARYYNLLATDLDLAKKLLLSMDHRSSTDLPGS